MLTTELTLNPSLDKRGTYRICAQTSPSLLKRRGRGMSSVLARDFFITLIESPLLVPEIRCVNNNLFMRNYEASYT